MIFSKAQIEQFFVSPVWKEMEERIQVEILKADMGVENPDPFTHGVAVGERRMARVTLTYKDILLAEAEQKNPYDDKRHLRKDDGKNE